MWLLVILKLWELGRNMNQDVSNFHASMGYITETQSHSDSKSDCVLKWLLRTTSFHYTDRTCQHRKKNRLISLAKHQPNNILDAYKVRETYLIILKDTKLSHTEYNACHRRKVKINFLHGPLLLLNICLHRNWLTHVYMCVSVHRYLYTYTIGHHNSTLFIILAQNC